MKLAVWLVANTSEHTPGPFVLRETPDSPAVLGTIYQTIGGTPVKPVCVVCRTDPFKGSDDPDGPAWGNPEDSANARLFMDAAEMLMLLARWSYLGGLKKDITPGHERAVEALVGETDALLVRHVRTGCAPVDADNRRVPPVYDVPGNPMGGT